MPEQKPPRSAQAELPVLTSLLQFQRESLVRKVSGISDEAARRSPVPSGTSLLWLLRHLARAEVTWIVERFAGEEGSLPPDPGPDADSLEAAVEAYRATWSRIDKVVASAPGLDAECVRPDAGEPVNLRWVLMHLLEETARHAGHADILRELIDGETGR